MSVDLNDEILQDFLVEAGEILEQLNEQLVDLEQSPEDGDLLNSIFRGRLKVHAFLMDLSLGE